MIVVDLVARAGAAARSTLRPGAMPQDVKLSPDGRTFYVADMASGGVWLIDAHTLREDPLPADRHGRARPVPQPRLQGPLRLQPRRGLDHRASRSPPGRPIGKWRIPAAARPDMGGVSADGRVLWLSGRYDAEVYAISTAHRAAAAPHPRRHRPARHVPSGPSPAATRSATRASCADAHRHRSGRRRAPRLLQAADLGGRAAPDRLGVDRARADGVATSPRTRSSPWPASTRRSCSSRRWAARTRCATSRPPGSSSSTSPPSGSFEQVNATGTDFPPDEDECGRRRASSARAERGSRPPRVARSPVALECVLHATVSMSESHRRLRARSCTPRSTPTRSPTDGLPAIDRLTPLSRLGRRRVGHAGRDPGDHADPPRRLARSLRRMTSRGASVRAAPTTVGG